MKTQEILEQFDKQFFNKVFDGKQGWETQDLEDFHNLLAQSLIDFAKRCIPTEEYNPEEKQLTYWIKEGFNRCREQTLANIERNGKV